MWALMLVDLYFIDLILTTKDTEESQRAQSLKYFVDFVAKIIYI